jgi:hypothetical protein
MPLYMVGGMYFEAFGDNFTYNMISALEEFLELIGLVLLIRMLLLFLAEYHPQVQLTFHEIELTKPSLTGAGLRAASRSGCGDWPPARFPRR